MDDKSPEFRERWAEIEATDGSWAFRIELLKTFVRDFPQDYPAWRQLGHNLAALSQFKEAEEALQTAMKLAPPKRLLWVYCDLGTLFRHKGECATSEMWFRKAIEHSPEDTQGYVLLGGILSRHGRLDEAEEVFRRGTRCTAGCVDEARLNLGFVLRALGRYEEALECFDKALKLDPQYKDARLAQRDVKLAIRFLESRRNLEHQGES